MGTTHASCEQKKWIHFVLFQHPVRGLILRMQNYGWVLDCLATI